MQNMGEKAQEVTLGTDHVRAKTLALLASCGGKLAGFQANVERRYFRVVRVRDVETQGDQRQKN